MFGIAKQQFKDKYKALFTLLGISLIFSEMYIAIYPVVREQADNLTQLLKMYPESFFKAFGLDAATLTFARVEYFLASEVFSVIWPILIIVLSIQLASYGFSAEIEAGTIELTLSQPVSRLKIFVARYFTGIFMLAIFCFASVGLLIPLVTLHGFEHTASHFWITAGIGFLFATAVYSIGTFFSVLFSQRSGTAFATAGTVILMYVANIISGLKPSLEKIGDYTFFHYFVGASLIGKGVVIQNTYWVFIGVSTLFFVLSGLWFSLRDIAT
jgi:ABC-2 type transport system permease protein